MYRYDILFFFLSWNRWHVFVYSQGFVEASCSVKIVKHETYSDRKWVIFIQSRSESLSFYTIMVYEIPLNNSSLLLSRLCMLHFIKKSKNLLHFTRHFDIHETMSLKANLIKIILHKFIKRSNSNNIYL